MKIVTALKFTTPMIAATIGGLLAGNANAEVNPSRDNVPGYCAPLPPPAPVAELMAASVSVAKGQSTTLHWTSQDATKCEVQPSIGPVQPKGSLVVTPDDTTTYTLVCSGDGGTARSHAQLVVVAPATAPDPAPVVVKEPTVNLCQPTDLNVQFALNKADIKPEYHEALEKVAAFLKEFPDAKGVIEGYTDNLGSKAGNIKLSQHRAESVRNYLVENLGIAPERIMAKGYGPAKPVADNKTKTGRQKNRRIEAQFACSGK